MTQPAAAAVVSNSAVICDKSCGMCYELDRFRSDARTKQNNTAAAPWPSPYGGLTYQQQ